MAAAGGADSSQTQRAHRPAQMGHDGSSRPPGPESLESRGRTVTLPVRARVRGNEFVLVGRGVQEI